MVGFEKNGIFEGMSPRVHISATIQTMHLEIGWILMLVKSVKFRNDLDKSIFAVSAALQSFEDRESIFTSYYFVQFAHAETM